MFDLAETDRLLTTTRSVRRRLDLDRPVELSVVLDCLRIAIQAPTASNAQDWRWLVVTDKPKRQALAELYRASAAGYFAHQASGVLSDQDRRVRESAEYLADVIDRVPVLVIPCIARRLRPELAANNAVAASFYGSILPAAWSFMLALRSRGLGTAWTTLHLAHEQEAAEMLGIPPTVTQVALLPVAYTIGDDFAPARRRPVEEFTYLDTWGKPIA
jgi:nitroreductase